MNDGSKISELPSLHDQKKTRLLFIKTKNSVLPDAIVRKHYSARLFAYIFFIILLSLLDAFFTLQLLYLGAAEINPVMAFFLQLGPTAFMAAKYILTAVCVMVMILGATHMGKAGNRLTDRLFFFLATAFGIVIFWELYLLFNALQ